MMRLQLPEELTAAQARASQARLCAQISASPAAQIHVDASAVRVFDSCALAVLLACRRSAQAAGKALTIQSLPPGLQAMAALYGVDALLD